MSGREEMEARGVLDVMDAIQYTPGVAVNTYGPDNRGWEYISLRGFSTYNVSMRDGLAQTPSGVTYYSTEPYGLERIEAVSYTHLDVYKRQATCWCRSAKASFMASMLTW